MAAKNTIDVIIGGKVLTLSGYESEEYLQQVGSYINHKINEVNRTEGFSHLSYDIQNMMIELNIADDYFKAKHQADHLESEIDSKDNELYNLKHDLINSKLSCEEANKKIDELKKENNELQKSIVRLETELSEYKKKSSQLELIKQTEQTVQTIQSVLKENERREANGVNTAAAEAGDAAIDECKPKVIDTLQADSEVKDAVKLEADKEIVLTGDQTAETVSSETISVNTAPGNIASDNISENENIENVSNLSIEAEPPLQNPQNMSEITVDNNTPINIDTYSKKKDKYPNRKRKKNKR